MGLLGMYLYPAYNPACVSYSPMDPVSSSLLRCLSELRSFDRFDPRVICTCLTYRIEKQKSFIIEGKFFFSRVIYDRRVLRKQTIIPVNRQSTLQKALPIINIYWKINKLRVDQIIGRVFFTVYISIYICAKHIVIIRFDNSHIKIHINDI